MILTVPSMRRIPVLPYLRPTRQAQPAELMPATGTYQKAQVSDTIFFLAAVGWRC